MNADIAKGAAAIVFDSRKVIPGAVFVAVPGTHDDGARYVGEAVAKGAAVVVVQEGVALPEVAARVVRVPDARRFLAELAARFHGNPSDSLAVYGVTGTNGKTTVAGLVRDMAAACGRPCGLLSTVEYSWPGHCEESSRTTPDPVFIQRAFAEMRRAGCSAVAMEVSSHALSQDRVAAVRFAAAGFTNLSQDHFDYHHDFEDYFACKRRLFERLGAGAPGAPALVNADDPFGRRLIADGRSLGVTPVPYSVDGAGEVAASGVSLGAAGTSFTLTAFGRSARVETGLIGRYNVSNVLCAAGMAIATGMPFDRVVETAAKARPRWGRLEVVHAKNGARVFVDYAHTPDAIEKALGALREVTRGCLTIVFGCGGDRDRAKRPLMAAVAARLADRVVLTSDNPRTEDPEAILDDVEAGIRGSATPYVRIADRRAAIAEAVGGLKPDDVVLVAGKGHENYQEVNGRHFHFDDREVVRQLIGG